MSAAATKPHRSPEHLAAEVHKTAPDVEYRIRMSFRFLPEPDVRALLPPSQFPALVDLMESTLVDFSAGRTTQPVRTAVPVGPPGQYLGVMPALLAGAAALGTKLVSVVPGNAARGLSTHLGFVALFDPVTGGVQAIMDARYITEVRTAAVSSVSVRRMARPGADRLAIIGTGVQARSHLEVIASIRTLSRVTAWSPDQPERLQYAEEMSTRVGVPVVASRSAEEALAGADLIVLATASDRPVIQDAWVAEGAHVVSVGACRPNQREMDPRLVARARLVVDSREAALLESGDVVQGIAEGHFAAHHIRAELGEVAAGAVAGRTAASEVTIFKSLGLAVEDVATAALAYRRALQDGRGVELSL
jgi:ornithine cyclodeaminase